MKSLIHLLVIFLVIALTINFSACSKNDGQVPSGTDTSMVSGKVLTQAEIRSLFQGSGVEWITTFGDVSYTPVTMAYLAKHQAAFEKDCFAKGMPAKWETRFDCNHFSQKYIGDACVDYVVNNWNSALKAQSPALGELRYHPKWANGQGHSIVVALVQDKITDPVRIVYWEPQPVQSHEYKLDAAELASVYKRDF